MGEKHRVRFLTVIWGSRYVREFARVSLPSYLAPGNLPFLAKTTDLEVVILTSRDSIKFFRSKPAFKRLRAICPVRFIVIDDLITTGTYGVTLTLAYARGVRDLGSHQTDTYCVFMNADFVLADGAMQTLVKCFDDGHRCIMAPSLRGRAEMLFPQLEARLDRTANRLVIAPREMVAMTLANLHPTVIAKTVTQTFLTCQTHNQIYWQVNETTLLGRSHLIFMLAIKPEVMDWQVNSYCDYGFVPEMVRSGSYHVIGDSDDFYMLELQPTLQEREYLRMGTKSLGAIAAELSRWTTREHRQFAATDTVFHSANLPADMELHRQSAARFMTQLNRRIRRRPIPHQYHFYWYFGVRTWYQLRSAQLEAEGKEIEPLPSEIGSLEGRRSGLRSFSRQLYLKLIDEVRARARKMPNFALWDHRWAHGQLLLKLIDEISYRPNAKTLAVAFAKGPVTRALTERAEAEQVLIDLKPDARPPTVRDDKFDEIVIHVEFHNLFKLSPILDWASNHLAPDGQITVFSDEEYYDIRGVDYTRDVAARVNELFPTNWLDYNVTARFVGGRMKLRLCRFERRLRRYLWPSHASQLPMTLAAIFGWPLIALFTAVNNMLVVRRTERFPPSASAMLLSLRKRSADTELDKPHDAA